MAVCLGDGREGVKNQNVEDISSQQIDTGPLIPASFFLPHMICIANGSSVALAFFWSQKRVEGGGGVRRSGVPTTHSSSCSPSPCPRIPPQLPLPSLLGLLLTTTGSLLDGEEAWTTLLPYRNRIVSPHRTIRSKKGELTESDLSFYKSRVMRLLLLAPVELHMMQLNKGINHISSHQILFF